MSGSCRCDEFFSRLDRKIFSFGTDRVNESFDESIIKRASVVSNAGKRFSACLVLVFITACGGGGENSSVGSLPDPDSPLLGTWEGAGCEISADFSRNNFYVFNPDGTVQLTFRTYAETNCTNLVYTDSAFARFTEGQARMIDGDRSIANLDFERIAGRTITPTSADSALSLNMSVACGFNDWQADVPREIQSCPTGLIEVDAQLLDVAQIYSVTDDYFLYFGDELIFSAEQRPTELTTVPSHIRQLPTEEGFPQEVLGFWQISGTSFYYELRSNALLVEYLPSTTRTDCFDVSVLATRPLGDDQYGAPDTQPIVIQSTQSGIRFLTSSGETTLEPAVPTRSTDLTPCASLPGG